MFTCLHGLEYPGYNQVFEGYDQNQDNTVNWDIEVYVNDDDD